MKKQAIIFSAALLLLAATSFATTGDTVPAQVQTAFEKKFSTAVSVNWEKTSDLYFAYFKLDQSDVKAVYNESGELMYTSRVLNFGELPLKVSMAIKDKYKGYTLPSTVTELVSDDETKYIVNVEKDHFTYLLHCSNNGDISVDNKTKK